MTKDLYVVLIFALLAFSCKEKEFQNPVDPERSLLAPEGLQVSFIADTAVAIQWTDNNPYGEAGKKHVVYEVEQSEGGESYALVKRASPDSARTRISGQFSAANTYFFRLRVAAGENKSGYSQPISGKLEFNAPSNLVVSAMTETEATLNWTLNNPLATMVIIERSTNSTSGFLAVDSMTSASTSRTISGIYNPDVSYYFRIQAKSAVNTTNYSNVASKSYDFPAPSNLVVSAITETQATLNWTLNNPFATMVLIERSTNSTSGFVAVDSVTSASTSKTINGAYVADVSYYFRVRAQSAANVSNYSNVVNRGRFRATVVTAAVSAVTSTSATLNGSVNPNGSTTTAYFEWGTDSTLSTFNSTAPQSMGSGTSAISVAAGLTGLSSNTTYYYRVAGVNNAGTQKGTIFNFSTRLPLLEMILVQGGTYRMGSTSGDSDEQPVHDVTLSSFSIGKYEVTQAQWREVVQWKQNNGGTSLNADPSYFKGDNLPVEQVSWNDIQTWIGHRNQMEGRNDYRLPTEAEWEYAARGGNRSTGATYSGSNDLNVVGWYGSNSGNQTRPVGTKQANELGIYDMSGNVWEWCSDWYGSYPSSPQTNPPGPATGTYRVVRGGSWLYSGSFCRVAVRLNGIPSVRYYYDGGFRLAR